jgi:hypothetical protein
VVEAVLEYILRAILYLFKTIVRSISTIGSNKWSCAEADVTAAPTASHGPGCPTVEVVYSYRFEGELYTGLHEEAFLLGDSQADYMARFSNGRNFVVRVKPGEPEISIVRDRDQVTPVVQSRVGESRP